MMMMMSVERPSPVGQLSYSPSNHSMSFSLHGSNKVLMTELFVNLLTKPGSSFFMLIEANRLLERFFF